MTTQKNDKISIYYQEERSDSAKVRIVLYEDNVLTKTVSKFANVAGLITYSSNYDIKSDSLIINFLPKSARKIHVCSLSKSSAKSSRLCHTFLLTIYYHNKQAFDLSKRLPMSVSNERCSFKDGKLIIKLSQDKQKQVQTVQEENKPIFCVPKEFKSQLHASLKVFPEAFVKELINSDEFMVKLANTIGYRMNNHFGELEKELSQQIKDQQIESSKELSDQLETGIKRISDHWDDYWLRN